MRPAEVIHLQISQCHLPKSGWGMLNLSGGVVTAGKEWTDDDSVHEVRSLNVLFQYYAKFLDGFQEHSNRLVEESMQERSRRSEDSSPKG